MISEPNTTIKTIKINSISNVGFLGLLFLGLLTNDCLPINL